MKHLQLPVNLPFGSRVETNYQRDGHDAHYIRVEHQIITPIISAGHRTCQVLPSASSVSEETSRGEAAASVCLYITWTRKTAKSAL